MLSTDEIPDDTSAHEAVCEELRGIAEALSRPRPAAPAPVINVAPSPPARVTVNAEPRPSVIRFTGSYNGKPVDLTATLKF